MVGRYMPWRPKLSSPTWRSFLRNHISDTAAVDMFVVVTVTFRLLYGVIVLGHDRRRIVHFNVTQNPTQLWLAAPRSPWQNADVERIIGSVRRAWLDCSEPLKVTQLEV